ncbi:uncharacterized protein LOC135143527 [Zophobas morio]|uniref:uncharacterized protein LOC135143527 n=1 Tax=Zophobas morio TaxID=2755281 RepID=UPI003083E308
MQPLPSWLQISNVDFRSNITKEQFLEHYESKGLPVVLTDVVTTWSAYRTWTKEYLMTLCGNRLFTAGSVSLSLADFFKISETIGDNSLYIFDKRFGEKVTELVADYVVPDYFSEDLFSVLGKNRPDYRWLVIGGRYSGSTFHIDPIATSAWNAVIRGKKKWILFPPGTVPPGVIPSEDLDSVATPESVLEWYLHV